MIKYTIQERFFLFVAITLLMAYSYQFYFLYEHDKELERTLKQNNEATLGYIEIINKQREEIKALKHALLHEQAMYQGQKTYSEQLEQQINTISEYYKDEIIKVNDELFDLKHKNKETFPETKK